VKFEIYKKGQGRYTRSITFVAAMVIIVSGAGVLSSKLSVYYSPFVQYGIPTGLVLTLGLLMFWIVNRQRTADFLIATEGEMKKVSWSSKKEIIGSTKVVIVTTFIMAALLFGVDVLFVVLFKWANIMG